MDIWKKIAALSKEHLGSDPPDQADFAEMSHEIFRPGDHACPTQIEDSAQANGDVEVLPEYTFLLKAIQEQCPAVFVTGRAGTGKSTLIRFLTSQLPRVAVVAPTAIAAMNVSGTTIHSFFGIPHRAINPDEAFNPRKHMIPVVENLQALIIDEVSMVAPDLVDCISNTLMKVRRNDLPFGGVPVVFVGDLLQLPTVVADRDVGVYYTHRYESPYFFSAEIFKRIRIFPLQLKRVFRQADEEFIAALDKIRTNRAHRDAVAFFNRQCCSDSWRDDEQSICLVPTNAAAKSINDQKLNALTTKMETYEALIDGDVKIGRQRYPAPDLLHLKEGARVVFVKNNKPMWLNGTLGEVVNLKKKSINVRLLSSGNIVPVSRETWAQYRYHYNYEKQKIEYEVVGSYSQFPLTLGWAITIHKSQGMTFDHVRIDLGRGAFCTGQTYVALSRCRSLDGICLSRPIAMGDVKVDRTIIEFYERLGFLDEDQN